MKLSNKVSIVSNVSKVSGVLSKTKLVNIESNHFINDLTHPTHLTHNTHLKRTGFTLAEVLITLGIIGVVAAITMPVLITNINQRVYEKRHQNIIQKVTQAMEQMRALDKLNATYATTDEFVDKLAEHLKIAKRCSANNIADCWPTDKVTDSNGDEILISNVKKGSNLNLGTTSDNVGLVLADGAALILNYNPNSQPLDIGSRVTANEHTTSVTDSIAFVVDINGKKGPNKDGEDIRNLNSASFTRCIKVGGHCIRELGYGYECNPNTDFAISSGQPDCWQGAVDACNALQGMHLPSQSDLQTIMSDVLGQGKVISGHHWMSTEGTDTTKAYQMHVVDSTSSMGTPAAISKAAKLYPLCVSD